MVCSLFTSAVCASLVVVYILGSVQCCSSFWGFLFFVSFQINCLRERGIIKHPCQIPVNIPGTVKWWSPSHLNNNAAKFDLLRQLKLTGEMHFKEIECVIMQDFWKKKKSMAIF